MAEDFVPFTDLWHEAAVRHADAPGVRDANEVVSFAELDRRIGAVGAAVAAKVPPGAVVAVVVPKTVWTLAAMFGVSAAGRAALLLDPGDPPARWAEHCRRVGAALSFADDPATRAVLAGLGLETIGPDDAPAEGGHDGRPAVGAEAVAVDPASDAWILCTSGSTGVPKLVGIPHRMMAEAWIRNRARLAEWGDPGRAMLITPPLSSAAIRMPLMLAGAAGACAVLVDTAATPPDRLLAMIDDYGVRRLSLNPWLLRALVGAAATRGRGSAAVLMIGTTGGSLSADDVVATWRWFPNAMVRSHYGATEFSGVANLELAPGTDVGAEDALALTVDADAIVRVVVDDAGTSAAVGEQGEIWIRSTRTLGRYRDAPDLTARASVRAADGTGWIRTGDLGRVLADGRLLVDGRDDARVKVNGIAVDLNAVTDAVRALDGVGDAEVSVIDRGDEVRLVAWVVADGGAFLSVRDLRAGLAPHLPATMMPHVFRAVAAIPRLRTGKPDRVALRQAASASLPVAADRRMPSTPLERELAARFETMLACPAVGVDESFFELGGDSLGALELVTGIVDRYGVSDERRLSVESAMMAEGTVAALARALDAGGGPPASRPDAAVLRPDGVGLLVLGAAGPDAVPVVLLPGGGQDPLAFRPLVRQLAGVRVWALTPRGFWSRARADRSLDEMTSRYADALLAQDAPRRYVLAGFSFGAIAAQHLATELVARGAEVPLLVLIDAAVPGTGHTHRIDPPLHRDPIWVRIPRGLAFRVRWRWLALTAGSVRRTGDAQGEAFLARAGRLLRGFPARPFAGRTVVVRSAHSAAEGFPPDLGWSAVCVGPLEAIDLPGNHFGVLLEPSVARIGEILAAAAGRTVEAPR